MSPCSLLPTSRRWTTAWVGLALATMLTSCAGQTSSGPERELDLDAPAASESGDRGSGSDGDDVAALRALVDSYDRAIGRVIRSRAREGSLDEVATPEFAEMVLGGYRASIYDQGDVLVGDVELIFREARVEGDTAEVDVCQDADELYVIPEGGTIQDGGLSQGLISTTFETVRDGDAWLVTGVRNRDGRC